MVQVLHPWLNAPSQERLRPRHFANRKGARRKLARAFDIPLFRRVASQYLDNRALGRDAMGCETLDVLDFELAGASFEQVTVIFTDCQRRRIAWETMWTGTPDRCEFNADEIVRRAVELKAAGVLVAHNHPSGDPAPSQTDVAATENLIQAGTAANVSVHDHIIVATDGIFSFRRKGMI